MWLLIDWGVGNIEITLGIFRGCYRPDYIIECKCHIIGIHIYFHMRRGIWKCTCHQNLITIGSVYIRNVVWPAFCISRNKSSLPESVCQKAAVTTTAANSNAKPKRIMPALLFRESFDLNMTVPLPI